MTLVQARGAKATIDYHSWGQEVLYPWGYTDDQIADTERHLRPPEKDKDKLSDLAKKMAEEIGGYAAKKSSAMYKTSGGSDDWAYSTVKSASFVVEVATEFQPPEASITGICNANIKGARWLMFWVADGALAARARGAP